MDRMLGSEDICETLDKARPFLAEKLLRDGETSASSNHFGDIYESLGNFSSTTLERNILRKIQNWSAQLGLDQ